MKPHRCSRLQSDVAAQLSRDALTLVLSSVPVDTPPTKLTPWLNADLIPFILREKPQHIVCITSLST